METETAIQEYNRLLLERILPGDIQDKSIILSILNELGNVLSEEPNLDDVIVTYRELLVLKNPRAAQDPVAEAMAEMVAEEEGVESVYQGASLWKIGTLARRFTTARETTYTIETVQHTLHAFVGHLETFSLKNEGVNVLSEVRDDLENME